MAAIFMRSLLLIVTFCFSFCSKGTSQLNDTLSIPKVKVNVSLLRDTFRLGDDIRLNMTLTNETKQIQAFGLTDQNQVQADRQEHP